MKKIISWLLISMLTVVAVIPAAAQTLNNTSPIVGLSGESAPGEGSVLKLETQLIDFGKIHMSELWNIEKSIIAYNYSGAALKNVKVTPQVKESRKFVVSGPGCDLDKFPDANIIQDSQVIYKIKPHAYYVEGNSGKYEQEFTITAQTSEGKNVEASFVAKMEVIDENYIGDIINKVNAPSNGVIWVYINDLFTEALSLDDFEITAFVNDKSYPIEVTDFIYNQDQSNVKILYKDIEKKQDIAQNVRITVKYKGDGSSGISGFMLPPGTSNTSGTVTFRFYDKTNSHNPVYGANVVLTATSNNEKQTKISDTNGMVSFKISPYETYQLEVTCNGYEKLIWHGSGLKDEYEFYLSKTSEKPSEYSQIIITVRDPQGNPIEGALCLLTCPGEKDGRAYTNANGVADVTMKSNTYTLTVIADDYISSSYVFSANQSVERFDAVLDPKVMCSVRTHVTNENGVPIYGAEVKFTCLVNDDLGISKTGIDGWSAPVSIRANDYIMTVSKKGYETYQKELKILKDSKFEVSLQPKEAVDGGNNGNDGNGSNSGNGNSGSGSSSNGNYSGNSSGNNNSNSSSSSNTGRKPVDADDIAQQTADAIKNADKTNGYGHVTVGIDNASSISPGAMAAVAATAANSGGKVTITADTVSPDGTVEGRLYIDPEKGSKLDKDIKLGLTANSEKTKQTTDLFNKYFDNNVAVVSFEQQGSFGMGIEAAVKVDLSNLDTSSLVFYSYDKTTNTYTPIPNTDYYIDTNGYLHFNTSVGGDIIISDKPMSKK